MTAAGWSVIRWARNVPTVHRKDGRPDHVAHLVLLLLATYADRDGRARPSLPTLADDARLTDRATGEALKRLCEHRLIASAAELTGGVTVWALSLDVHRPDGERAAAQERRVLALKSAANRSKRYRDKLAGRHAVVGRDVTHHDGVTLESVTPHDGVRHAVPTHTSRAMGAYVTPSPPSQPQVTPATTAIELPEELPIELPAGEPAETKKSNAAYTVVFEEFWAAYGKKGKKAAAAIEWAKALKRADRAVIMRQVGPYVASTPELRWRLDAERWLKNDGWESVIVPARPSTSGGHQPHRNPADQSVYDEPLI